MRTAWASLPNGALIDRILDDVAARPEAWAPASVPARGAARGAAREAARHAREAAREAAWGAAREAAREAAWEASQNAAWEAAWGASQEATWDAAWGAARGAVAALVAWDDSAELLALDPDAVRLLAASGHTPAVLLIHACIALKPT